MTRRVLTAIVFIFLLTLSACQTLGGRAVSASPIVVDNQPIGGLVPTPETGDNPDRTLVVCLGSEPDSLYYYGSSMLASSQVMQAIYDGPIDNRSYSFQPVILQKLPSLADGDAVLEQVTVSEGELIVTDDVSLGALEPGMIVRPSGCFNTRCAIEYTGGEITLDQMVVTFKLLPGLKWSDGAPLTIHDSIFSFNLNADPQTPTSKFTIERTASYTAQDDLTSVWTALPGFTDSTYFLNFWTPLPEHILDGYTAEDLLKNETSTRAPTGWGPYEIEGWNMGENIVLHKNPHYFRAGEGLPHFEHLIFRFVGENPNANIAAIISGECDIIDQSSRLQEQTQLLSQLEEAGHIQVQTTHGAAWEHVSFGIAPYSYEDSYAPRSGDRPDFFGDTRTRQAIALCMDRAQLNTVLYGNNAIATNSYVPREHPLFNPTLPRYDYDPEAGLALLEEVGWVMGEDNVLIAESVENVPDGTRFEVNYWTTNTPIRQQASQILQQTLSNCGIWIDLQYWVPAEFFDSGPQGPIFGRRFDMVEFAWLSGSEPTCELFVSDQISGDPEDGFCGWGCLNLTGWSSPEYDNACHQALNSLPGQITYAEYHLEAQRIFAQELPAIPLYQGIRVAAARPDMCGFILDPTMMIELWNIESFNYGKGCGP